MIAWILAGPFLAAVLMLLASGRDREAALRLGLSLAALLALSAIALFCCAPAALDVAWFTVPGSSATVRWHLDTDGLSSWLAALVLALGPAAILGAATSCGDRLREFAVAAFAMQGCLLGALFARDLVLFYVFFEAMLLPALMLVGLFGDPATRLRAGVQFLLYTMVGSFAMLVAIWYLAAHTGTVQIPELPEAIVAAGLTPAAKCWCFCAFALAFLVKTPVVPLHGWQAPLYAACPAAAAVLIAGAMAKMGPYGLMRIVAPLFPAELAAWAPTLVALGVLSILYGALLALVQSELRRILAYSSLSHLGLVVVGVVVGASAQQADAQAGALVQMLGHGLAAAALFLIVGAIETRGQRSRIESLGGLAGRTPALAVLTVIAVLAALAVPGTVGFVGEFLLLRGTYAGLAVQQGPVTALVVTSVAGASLVLGAAYVLRWVQRSLYGAEREATVLPDLNAQEGLAVVPLLVASVVLGLFPAAVVAGAGIHDEPDAAGEAVTIAAPLARDTGHPTPEASAAEEP